VALGTTSIDGLISGFDTTNIVSQLIEIERAPITRLQAQQTDYTNRLTALRDLNTRLLALASQANMIVGKSALEPRQAATSDASAVQVAANAGADLGTYGIVVSQLASTHKLSSGSFASRATALGLAGEFLLNGRVIAVAPDDTLTSLCNRINSASAPNAGATATIMQAAQGDYRLVLTSTQSGAANAIDLVDANSTDLLEALGLASSADPSIKSPIANGAQSDAFADPDTAVQSLLGIAEPLTGTVYIGGDPVDIDLATDSITMIRDAINAAASGVAATIVREETDAQYRLQIVGQSGTPSFQDVNNILVALGILQKAPASELAGAEDAQFSIDGIDMTRASNVVSDSVAGVTFSLLQADPAQHVWVQVAEDPSATEQAIRSFVDQYNNLVDFINQQQEFDQETGRSGTLFGDAVVSRVLSGLRRAASNSVQGVSGAVTMLAHVGITADSDDRLVIDGAELASALQSDPAGVAALFRSSGATTDADVTFISVAAETQPSGSYAVVLTAAATQASVTGNDVSGGLAQGETININGAATVNLAAGMTTSQVVDALNDALEAAGIGVTASAEGGAVRLVHDRYGSQRTFTVTSSVGSGTPGSTGLGSATPAEPATYVGTDVAGTVGGEAATGNGQLLTGNTGNAHTAGLVLRITATAAGSQGTVSVVKGVGTRVAECINSMTDAADGPLSIREAGVQEQIDALGDEITKAQARLEQRREDLTLKFVALEATLSRLQNQSERLLSQLNALSPDYLNRTSTSPST
jgi:flagellar hook-associated protein 2